MKLICVETIIFYEQGKDFIRSVEGRIRFYEQPVITLLVCRLNYRHEVGIGLFLIAATKAVVDRVAVAVGIRWFGRGLVRVRIEDA